MMRHVAAANVSSGARGRTEPVEMLGIDHVQVAAPPGSEATARRFFGDLLGLPELSKPAALRSRGGAWFACGAHQLHVGIAEDFAPATKAHPALAVAGADLGRLAARLLDAGCPVQWDDAIPDTRRFYTTDPWGNRIELVGRED
jgi:catechol 2,3-dioxygenase-like lactoylglutathione lyase family enzyme